jgi:hypothetical protein
MGLLSNRHLAAMTHQLAASMGQTWFSDTCGRLILKDSSAVAAQWEVLILHALSQAGTVRSTPDIQGRTKPDAIFLPDGETQPVVVEITALSDEDQHGVAAVETFWAELRRVTAKRGLLQLGAFSVNIARREGSMELALPVAHKIAELFKSPLFTTFFSEIRNQPLHAHELTFEIDGDRSTVGFRPGAQFSSGTGPMAAEIESVGDNIIVKRLLSKASQVKKSGLEMPAIVFLADNGCRALSRHGVSPWNPVTYPNIIDQFLNGPGSRHHFLTPPTQRSSKRTTSLNAVYVIRVSNSGGLECDVTVNSTKRKQALPDTLAGAVERGLRTIPTPLTTPANACRELKFPAKFGDYQMSGNRVKMSLLTLQGLLTGRISQADFAKDHPDLVRKLRGDESTGLAFSSVNIEFDENDNDDWVVFELGRSSPAGLAELLSSGR